MFYFFYYFPIGLDLRSQRRPWATWAIAAACVAGFLLQRLDPELFWANSGALLFVPRSPSPSSLLLNAYFHGGWLHLVSNLVTLFVFGPVLEDRLGWRRYLVFYHAANVAANLMQGALVLIFQPAQATFGVLGASGALAGLLGFFAVRMYFARLRVAYWTFLPLQAFTRAGAVMVPASFAIGVWFMLQLAMAMLQREGVGAGIACGSHLGGLLAGFALAQSSDARRAARAEAHLQRGRSYLDRAAWYAAQGEFIEYVRAFPGDVQGHLELARTYRLTGRHPLADQHYRRACQLHARQRRLDRVEETALEAERGNPRFVLDPKVQLQLARALERSFKNEIAARAYLRFAETYAEAAQTPWCLYRAARLASRDTAGRVRAENLYKRLLERYPLSPEAALARTALALEGIGGAEAESAPQPAAVAA
jgi:membrane associated rhomboid family serine protease